VEEPLQPSEPHGELWKQVHAAVRPDQEPWRTFTETVAREAQARMRHFGR